MVRGDYLEGGASARLALASALDRYLSEATPPWKPATRETGIERAKPLLPPSASIPSGRLLLSRVDRVMGIVMPR